MPNPASVDYFSFSGHLEEFLDSVRWDMQYVDLDID